jgi:uncharacterized protein YaeQ
MRSTAMALTATIYNLEIDLADIDRGVYEKLALLIARQPSETLEYMLMRIFAYCLEYTDGIELTEGVAAGAEPAVLIRDLTGRITAWIESACPSQAGCIVGTNLPAGLPFIQIVMLGSS